MKRPKQVRSAGEVAKLVDDLRDVVNHSAVIDELVKDKRNWDMLCSAMDVIGDTDLAIEAYASCAPDADAGELYLMVYGLFQSMYVQQDAANYTARAVDMKFSDFSKPLRKIRDLRNSVFGHPPNNGGKSYGIIRIFMTHERFDVHSFSDWHVEQVQVFDLIAQQNRELSSLLRSIIAHLKAKYPRACESDPNIVRLTGPTSLEINIDFPNFDRTADGRS